ncbi:pastrel [Carabus blaptoides fortunei]
MVIAHSLHKENNMESSSVQQNFYDNLGNRDFDCFREPDQKYLKLKIAYTLYGPPTKADVLNNISTDFTAAQCYDKAQNIKINGILTTIKTYSKYNEDPNETIVSFLFNCCEPLKKAKSTENGTNISCYPVYKVRKCTGSPTGNNCCVFVDDQKRVYKNWQNYLDTNKIPKARMCVPQDGKYQGDENNQVLLTHSVSPACHLVERVKRGADVTTTVASLLSGGIAVGAMVPAITVAPVLLAGAVLTGAGAGVYAIFRSSFVLHDRRIHAQSISPANTEARNCYLNIVTGAMGVVTTGATKVASVAINRGAVVTETAATALLSVNVANLAVNGCNAANSAYSVISDLVQKKNPSALDIMHLTTTVLFFGNAVINFKSAHAIYKQSQTRSLTEMFQSQKDNLWQRAKRAFFDADVTTYEHNSTVKEVNSNEEVYLSSLGPVLPDRQMNVIRSTETMIQTLIDLQPIVSFGYILIKNRDNVYAVLRIILSRFDFYIQEKLLKLVNWLIGQVIKDAYKDLTSIFPDSELFVVFTNYVINFFKFNVTALEIDYQSKTVRRQS